MDDILFTMGFISFQPNGTVNVPGTRNASVFRNAQGDYIVRVGPPPVTGFAAGAGTPAISPTGSNGFQRSIGQVQPIVTPIAPASPVAWVLSQLADLATWRILARLSDVPGTPIDCGFNILWLQVPSF